ncbi:MAG: transglycosylase domain-containing protein [bacterium]|nr:transglycosylase domain-containing protein [bacterium]
MHHHSYKPKRPYSPGEWREEPPRHDRHRLGARRRRNARRARTLIRALLLLGVAGLFVGGLAFAVLLAWAARDLPDPTRLMERAVPQSTKMLDRTGEHVLFEFHGEEKRTRRSLDEIAEYAKWATIAIEDRAFYAHKGFRFTSFVRAALSNLRGGGRAQGGSTITQQLVKNAILTPEKTYRRKLRELLIAYQLEQRFTKDEILTLYLNEIPFGSNAYGIESAAQTFFGKTAATLDLAESATLAGLPKAPTRLSPYGSHTDELVARAHFILDRMAEYGYITQEEADTAKHVDVLARVQARRDPITAPHFVMYVRELLTEQFGERAIEQGGLRVTTTLDYNLFTSAEAAIAGRAERNEKSFGATNAALVAVDPSNGHILAMVGSRDFFNDDIDGQVNVAVRPRQPGSSFKPIVYVTAFEQGYVPETIVADVATTFPSSVGDYEPKNYDGKERGFISLRSALAGSLNIPAVKVLYLAGMDTVLDRAERLGYTTLADRSRFGLSLVLGGGEVTLLEHTAAYAALAADGTRRAPVAVLKVEDPSGAVLMEWVGGDGERVLPQQAVRQLTSVMKDNQARTYVFGSRSPLAFTDREVAAKTGTTNDFRDAWTMGFTPSLAWGVWVGNSDNTAMRGKADGSVVAAPIWRAFADAALATMPKEMFPQPDLDQPDKPILRGEHPGIQRVRIDRATGKRATDATPPELVEERTYQDLHDILHYVRRDDPRGPAPEDPAADPMYAPWEAGVTAWAAREGITLGPPPSEVDDLHTEANRPVLTVQEPAQQAIIPSRTFVVAGTVAAPRGVTQMTVEVDGIQAALFAPSEGTFRQTVRLPAPIGRGAHAVAVSAVDDAGNRGTVVVPVDVQTDREPVTLEWRAPAANAIIPRASFPVTIELAASTTIGTNRVEIFVDGTSLTSVRPSDSGTIRILWPSAPAPGTHTLRAKLYATNDTLLAESEALGIVVE